MSTQKIEVGQGWRHKHLLDIQTVVEVSHGYVWVRSWAFGNGFPETKFRELYEFVEDVAT